MVSEHDDEHDETHPPASMEPCLFRHGKVKRNTGVHDQVLASMEPCLFRHGKVVERLERRVRHTAASMEPCLFRHGKGRVDWDLSYPGPRFNGAMSFQTW